MINDEPMLRSATGLTELLCVCACVLHMGVSEKRGPEYSTLNSRILIIRTPKQGTPNFRKLPYLCLGILGGSKQKV